MDDWEYIGTKLHVKENVKWSWVREENYIYISAVC